MVAKTISKKTQLNKSPKATIRPKKTTNRKSNKTKASTPSKVFINKTDNTQQKGSYGMELDMNKLYKAYLKDGVSFHTEMYYAGLKAFNNFYHGIDHMFLAYHEFVNTIMEANIKACETITSCKNAQDALAVQSNLARDQFAKFMTEGSKISEMSVHIANETFEPINECFSKTIGKTWKKN